MIENCVYIQNCNGKLCSSDFCIRKVKLDYLYDTAGVPLHQRKHIKISLKQDTAEDARDINAFKRLSEISNNIENYVSSGQNLYLHSSISGNGKTSWALRLLESYFDTIWAKTNLTCRALFISVSHLFNEMKNELRTGYNEYVEHIKKYIISADVIIWDDIATKFGTEYERDQLLNILDQRIAHGKSNIFTSNLNNIQLTETLGNRLGSRICNMSEDIELFGVDKRKWRQEAV